MRIHIASDHAGFELKSAVIEHLRKEGHTVVDHGAHSYDPDDDYPAFCLDCGEAVVGGRMHDLGAGLAIIDAFLAEPFSGDERHARRIAQLSDYESRAHDAASVADPSGVITPTGA